jgi:hypothetical protein
MVLLNKLRLNLHKLLTTVMIVKCKGTMWDDYVVRAKETSNKLGTLLRNVS